jgi:hypothetical protein
MSKPEHAGGTDHEPDEAQGPNLKLLYGLIALALVAAVAIAALIVFPFYLRR